MNALSTNIRFDGIKEIDMSVKYSEMGIDLSIFKPEGMHFHDCFEIYVNLGGEVSFVVENSLYEIEFGDIIITKPNEFHYCLYKKNTFHKCECIWLKTSPENPIFADLEARKNGKNNLIRLEEKERSDALDNCKALLLAYQEQNKRKLMIPLFSLLEKIGGFESESPLSVTVPDNIKAIFDYIDCNFTSVGSLEKVYEKFFISPSTLYRYYKKYLSISPSKYIEAKRLSKARSMLSQGKPAIETCLESGFTDYAHFISIFKKTYGITPGKYSRKAREEKEL